MSQNRKILVFETTHTLTNYLLKRWVELSVQTIKQDRDFIAALSGGRTPVEFYCKLAGLKNFEVWKRCHLFLTDERFVSVDDEDSNFGMLMTNLINYIDIPAENVHPIRTDKENAERSAEDFQKDLEGFFGLKEGGLPSFDILLLGVGNDGHVASIFPGDENSQGKNILTLSCSDAGIEHQRISLTLSVINNAQEIFVIVTGEEKSGIIKAIFEEKFICPASLINPKNGQITYLMDRKAVSKLSDKTEYMDEGEAVCLKAF